VGTLDEIPASIRRDYTKDGPFYRLKDPYIQKAAKEAIGDETNVFMQVRKIWLYVRERLYYLGDGRKDSAPRVLQQGHGSCTEYSFSMIALCRANGIPARYISGSIAKAGGAKVKSRDNVFHKIVEVYLPRIGWIPMESTAGGRYVDETTADEQIGKLRPRMLFFQHELERGLAPLDPRRNTLTWINKTMRSHVKLAGSVVNIWERVKTRAE
jgi:transglutaminase-like putative cysteine protease